MQSNQSPEMQNVAGGMSRASLKRKRKLSKGNDSPGQINKQARDSIDSAKIDTARDDIDRRNSRSSCHDNANAIADVDIDIQSISLMNILNLADITDITEDQRASTLLSLLTYPTSRSTFYREYWDKKPLHCPKISSTKSGKSNVSTDADGAAGGSMWLKQFLTKKSIEKICERQVLVHLEDIVVLKATDDDIDCYSEKVNESVEDPDEKVSSRADELFRLSLKGYSLIFLQLQLYSDNLWRFLSVLEHEFSSSVSCHLLWTGAGCNGFGAARVTSDSFFVQIVGKSNFNVYDVIQLEIEDESEIIHHIEPGLLPDKPYLTTVLNTGDNIYVPRGYVYKNLDFVELILSQAVRAASTKPKSLLQKSLRRGYMRYMGVSASEADDNDERDVFLGGLKNQFEEVVSEAMDMADAAADQMVKKYISQRLPVPLTPFEEARSSAGAPSAIIYPFTKLRIIRPNIARALVEDGMVVLYHCMDNARSMYDAPMNPLEFELDDGPAIEGLLNSYPNGIVVSDLYHPSEELDDKVSIAQALYKEGILVIEDEASKPEVDNDHESDNDDPF